MRRWTKLLAVLAVTFESVTLPLLVLISLPLTVLMTGLPVWNVNSTAVGGGVAEKPVYKRGDGSTEIGGHACDWYEGYRGEKLFASKVAKGKKNATNRFNRCAATAM